MATLEAAAGAGASASAGAITMRRPLASVHVSPVVDDGLATARENLRRVTLSGARTVRHGDKEITYRSQTELAQAMAAADQMIANAGRPAIRTIVFNCSKGLE